MAMLVREIMKRRVISLQPLDTLREAVAVFAKNGISGAPVVDEKGRVVGILTEMDILRRLEIGSMMLGHTGPRAGSVADARRNGPGLRFISLSEALEGAADLIVSKVMTSPVVTARPGDLVQEKAALMVHRRIRRLPVVDSNGILVGILSREDLIWMLHVARPHQKTAAGPPGSRRGRASGKKRGRGNA